MDLRSLGLVLLAQSTQFKYPFLQLDIITEKEGYGKESKDQQIKSDLKGLLVNFQMLGLGGLMSKNENIEVFLVQDGPPVSPR
jgi:hypothetical protein